MKKIIVSLCILLFVLPLVAAYNINVNCPSTASVGDTVTCTLALTDPNGQGPIAGPFGAEFGIAVNDGNLAQTPGTGDGGIDFTPISPISGSSGGLGKAGASIPRTVLFTLNSNTINPQNVATFNLEIGNNGVLNVFLDRLIISSGPTATTDPQVASNSATINIGAVGNVCGDGVIGGSEQCDDRNVVSGDGCSATCQIERGYTCTGQPSVCTLGGGTCIEGENVVTSGCTCNSPMEQLGNFCPPLLDRVRTVLNDNSLNIVQKVSLIANELRVYFTF